jgi:hypothetical protein
MKLKIKVIFIMLLLVVNIPNIAVAQTTTANSETSMKEIRVALFTMGDLYGSTLGLYLKIFNGFEWEMGNGYQWQVGNISYRMNVKLIDDNGIFHGELNTKNFDVLLIPYMEAEYLIQQHYKPTIHNCIWKKRFADFVKDGGGYIGYCASAVLVTKLSNRPDTFNENMLNKMHVDITKIKSYVEAGIPFLIQLSGHPEKIGPPAYQWLTGWNASNPSDWLGGCCIDFVIDKDNPIFNDLYGDTRRIRWIGGPSFVVPNSSDNNVKIIAYYPDEEISDNESTQIHAWKYVGRLIGFIRGFIRSTRNAKSMSDALYFTPFQAIDWKMTETIIETNLSNKPFMTMETYPNENQGRIILCGGHPEDPVWWSGSIEEMNDTKKNCLYDALNRWHNITPPSQTIEDENTYNWWIVRRHAAWAGKVPDSDLPPIYGSSQISDISPYQQQSPLKIIGNVESSSGIIYLDLYYRFSFDNNSWSEWNLYSTDTSGSDDDGWSWLFDSPNGPGYYQFYSIRRVQTENEWIYETAPPGPDALTRIME